MLCHRHHPLFQLCSSTKKLPTPVPRLDLTPVLASLAAESEASPHGEGHSHNGMLLLEDAPRPRRLELDDEADEGPATQPHSGERHTLGPQVKRACRVAAPLARCMLDQRVRTSASFSIFKWSEHSRACTLHTCRTCIDLCPHTHTGVLTHTGVCGGPGEGPT